MSRHTADHSFKHLFLIHVFDLLTNGIKHVLKSGTSQFWSLWFYVRSIEFALWKF